MNYEEMTDAILNEGIFNRFISNNTSAKNQRDAIIRQSNQNKSNIEKKYENIKPKEKEYKKPEIEFKPYILKVPQKKTPTISRKEAVKKAVQILKDILKKPNFKEFSSAVKIEYDGKYSFYDEYIEYDNDESEKPENCCLSIAGVSAYGITDDPRDQSENNKFWNFVNDLVTESNKKLTNFGYILDVEGDRDGAGISIYTIPDFITYYNSEECYNKEYIKLESTNYEELTDILLEELLFLPKKIDDSINSVFNKVFAKSIAKDREKQQEKMRQTSDSMKHSLKTEEPNIPRNEAIKKIKSIFNNTISKPEFKELKQYIKLCNDAYINPRLKYYGWNKEDIGSIKEFVNSKIDDVTIAFGEVPDEYIDEYDSKNIINKFTNALKNEMKKYNYDISYIVDDEWFVSIDISAGIKSYQVKESANYEELTDSLLEGFFSKTKTEYKLEDGIPSIEVVFNKVKQISNKLLNGKYKSIKKYIKLVNSINTDNKLWKWKSVHIGVADIETMDEDEYNSNIDDINGYIQSLNDELESMYGTHECKNYSKAVPYYSIDMAGDDGEIFLDTTAYIKVKVNRKTGEEIKR